MNGSRRLGYLLLAVAIVLAAVLLGFVFRSSDSTGSAKGDQGQTGEPASPRARPMLKVAFIADQGFNDDARAVLDLIRTENADMVLHQGDFDYIGDPRAWDAQIDEILGPAFPYFASVGNHDVGTWPEYQLRLQERLERVDGAACDGDLGVNSACSYRGLFFVLSGIGTLGADHVPYLREALAADRSVWRVCSWHKNQESTQIGGKGDSVGWDAYETCRRHGAIIATGHEHSYSRTKTLRRVEAADVDSTCDDDRSTPEPDVCVGAGSTFLFVSGLAGSSVRDQERCFPTSYPYGCDGEWAKIYAEDQGAQFGALFVSFDMSDDGDTARGYFKTIDGDVIDSFTITRR